MESILKFSLPDGTHYILPAVHKSLSKLISTLKNLYESWGYEEVDVPVLEHYQPKHPAADKSFKLSDRDSGVLSLRADFTPAIANLARIHYPNTNQPLRFQYSGKLWQTIAPDMMRTREFTQAGVELIGTSNARADAELIHLARESLRSIGLVPRIEIGNPGLVKALFYVAEIPLKDHELFAQIIDRKDLGTLSEKLESLNISTQIKQALTKLIDLYGDVSILKEARALAMWPETKQAIERLIAVIEQFEHSSELLINLGMARRLSYYTGVTFRAYTPNFGQPLLGGGRYDGDLLPYAAGFAIGLERVMKALPKEELENVPLALANDDVAAQILRDQGYVVIRSLDKDEATMCTCASQQGIPYVLTQQGLKPLVENPPDLAHLKALLGEVSE